MLGADVIIPQIVVGVWDAAYNMFDNILKSQSFVLERNLRLVAELDATQALLFGAGDVDVDDVALTALVAVEDVLLEIPRESRGLNNHISGYDEEVSHQLVPGRGISVSVLAVAVDGQVGEPGRLHAEQTGERSLPAARGSKEVDNQSTYIPTHLSPNK